MVHCTLVQIDYTIFGIFKGYTKVPNSTAQLFGNYAYFGHVAQVLLFVVPSITAINNVRLIERTHRHPDITSICHSGLSFESIHVYRVYIYPIRGRMRDFLALN